jgi:hypothetical protein
MITGNKKTEKTYRAIEMNSSSSLKEFSLDRKKYYKKYILSEAVEDKDTQAATTGRIVETLLLEPEEFDNRFYMSSCATAPTGLMLAFVDALYTHTANATDEEGKITRSFEDLAKDAYTDSGFKIKFDAVLSKFQGSDAEIFYNEMRIVRGKGLTVITTEDVTNAEKIVEELRNNPITAGIVNLVDSRRWQIFNQFQVEGYEIDGMKFKSMMDKVIVDHDDKTIQVYDLKCVWAVENFYEEYYLYRRAYIQAFLYHRALLYTEDAFPFDHNDYEILYPKFIVCDSTNYMSPLVYVLDDDDMEDAYRGFAHKHRQYPGVKEIIADLKWAIENDRWNISRKNHISEGRVKLRG